MTAIAGHHGLHQTVTVAHPNGRAIPVDAELAELVGYLWARGVKTTESCQDDWENGNAGMASISFAAIPGAVKFVRMTVQYAMDCRSYGYLDVDYRIFNMRLWDNGMQVLFPVWAIRLVTEAWQDITGASK